MQQSLLAGERESQREREREPEIKQEVFTDLKKNAKDPDFANPSFEIGFVFKIKSSIYFKIARSAQNVGYATKRIWAQSNNLSTFSPPIGQQLLNIFLYADCWHARVKDEVIELIFSPPFSMAE